MNVRPGKVVDAGQSSSPPHAIARNLSGGRRNVRRAQDGNPRAGPLPPWLELPNRAHLEYNDGAVGPASGYSEIPDSLSYPVPRPSSYESSGKKGVSLLYDIRPVSLARASKKLVGFAPLLHLFSSQETAIPCYALTLACASAWAA